MINVWQFKVSPFWALKQADSTGQLFCGVILKLGLPFLTVRSVAWNHFRHDLPMQFLMQPFFQKLQRVGGPGEATLLPGDSVSNDVRSKDLLLFLMSSLLLLSQFRALFWPGQMLSWIVNTYSEEKEPQVFMSLFIVWRSNICLFNSHSNWKQKSVPQSKLFLLPTRCS